MNILDEYVLTTPSNQNVFDIFQGEWSSQIPRAFNIKTVPGTAGLFEDARVTWTEQVFGSLKDMDILELGPLEAGHTYMFQQRGARKIVAIEANKRAFMKCLCVKEVLNLDRAFFKLGDFVPYLKNSTPKFDLTFASGVLYHMEEPMELLKLISDAADKVFIWTHYYDERIIKPHPALSPKFTKVQSGKFSGFSYEYSVQSYNESLQWSGFCGGSAPKSKWLTRESILNTLKHFGYNDIQIGFDHPDHQNGPAFAICARK